MKTPQLPKPYRLTLESMDRALDKNAPPDYSELIERFGRAHFGDSWKPRPLPGEPDHKPVGASVSSL